MKWTLLVTLGLVLLVSLPQSSNAKPAPKPQDDAAVPEEETTVEETVVEEEESTSSTGSNTVPVDDNKPKPDELAAAPAAAPPVEDTLERPPTDKAPELVGAGASARSNNADGDCDAVCMLSHQTPLILFACILVSILLLLVILLGCYFMRKLHGRAILTTNQRIPASTLKPGDVIQRKTTETKQVVGAGKNEQKIVTTTTTKVVSSGGAAAGGE